MNPRGTVGRIYKEDHYTLLLTKYESSGPCGFGEDFFMFFPFVGSTQHWANCTFFRNQLFCSFELIRHIYKNC